MQGDIGDTGGEGVGRNWVSSFPSLLFVIVIGVQKKPAYLLKDNNYYLFI